MPLNLKQPGRSLRSDRVFWTLSMIDSIGSVGLQIAPPSA
jgi:hypothetical protein